MKNRIKRLEKLEGNNEFRLMIVEKVDEDLYIQVDNKSNKYSRKDLDELIEYYSLEQDERMKARAKIVEQKLFGTTE